MKTLLFTVLLACTFSYSFSQIVVDCNLLHIDSITIDTSTNPNSLNVYIYNGDTVQVNYPYINYLVDLNVNDTLVNDSTASWFAHLPGTSQVYSFPTTRTEVSPGMYLELQFTYASAFGDSSWPWVINESCLLYHQTPLIDCNNISVTDIYMDSAHYLEITIFNGDTNLLYYPYVDDIIDNTTGDTILLNGPGDWVAQFPNTSQTYTCYIGFTNIDTTIDWTIYFIPIIMESLECQLTYSGLTTAVKDLSMNNQITLFPNPASSTISFLGAENLNKIIIYDMLGNIHVTHQNLAHALDVSQLSQGVYLVMGYQNDLVLFSKQLIINR